ncbi:MAG: tRNA1(Val) (adenine(37)-N6)-methyltransferase [Nitrospirae bacterium]|nr:tRNA1(Val) (adenine(37)-N6)-methyltransferase [Nitrospirota bacterium]
MDTLDRMDLTLDTIKDVKIYQKKKGYRFSIDAPLLSGFVKPLFSGRAADIGAGSGIIGLLLAKKYEKLTVQLFEIQEELYALSLENIRLNGVEDRVSALNADVKDLLLPEVSKCPYIGSNSFDIVVSNPPFRKIGTGLINPHVEKAVARHELELTLDDLTRAAFCLLRGKGRFYFIHHPTRFIEAIDALRDRGLQPVRARFVHSDESAWAKMFLMECVKEGKPTFTLENPFYIYKTDGSYTEDTLALLGSTRLESD